MHAIRPTSKATLKLQCLFVCKGDIAEAAKLYDYFAADMPELPDYDPVQPTWMDNTKDAANGIIGWLKENQDTLAQGYEFINNIIKRRGITPTATTNEPLPPING